LHGLQKLNYYNHVLWIACKYFTTIKCGCSSLVAVHYTNEFTQNPMKSLGVQGHLCCNVWIGLKISGNLKNKIQVFESRWNVFASIWFFKKTLQYWCGEHFNIYFLVNQFFFHN
jgi:hypothetical protein